MASIVGNATKEALFKGAYAEYRGTYLLMSATYDVRWRIEIMDLNETHVKVRVSSQIIGLERKPTIGEIWVNKTNWVNEYFVNQGWELSYVEKTNCGIMRKCIVYTYIDPYSRTIIIYIDESIGWPIRFTFKHPVYGETEIHLYETNVPGLK